MERVVQRDASGGRILLVLPHDPAAHQRKARGRQAAARRAAFLPNVWGRPESSPLRNLPGDKRRRR